MKRLAAIVAAVAMVAGAFALRAALDGDAGDGGGGGGTTAGARVVCVTELGPVCESLAEDHGLDVEVAPYAETVELLAAAGSGEDVDVDAWVAPAPVVGMVADERDRAGMGPVLDEVSPVVARSPLVLVAWEDRVAALEGTCGGSVTWSCLGEVADDAWADTGGEPGWGRVKVGHDDPARSSVGLLVAGQAAADRLERQDFASNDFVEPGFREWLSRLERTVSALDQGGGSPLTRMIGLGPAAYDAVGTTEAEGVPQVARSARYGDQLQVLYPSPTTTVDVVVAPVLDHGDGDAVAELFSSEEAGDAFAAAGWRVAGRPPDQDTAAEAMPDLPDDDGTAAPGALTALLQLLEEIT